MLRTAGRQSFQKIIISTLASTLLIFPVLVRSNPVAAQNEMRFSSEQVEEALGENADEIQKNLLLSNFYMSKYHQTGEIGYLEQAIESVQKAVHLQPDFVFSRIMLYGFLSQKAIVQKDEALLAQLEAHYQALRQSSLELEDFKQIPPPAHVAGALYYRISSEPMEEEEELRYEQKAIDVLQQAIRINPDFYGSHLLLGRIFYVQDKNDLAFSEVQEAIRLNGNDPDNYELLGDIYADNIHRAEDGWDEEAIIEGIRAYKQAIRLAPRHVGAHQGLSGLYIHQGAYNLAVMEGKIAVELSDNPFSHRLLGISLLFAKDYKQAIQEYREGLRQDKNKSYAILHAEIAFVHFLQSRFEDAAKEYQKYIELEDADHLNTYSVIHYYLTLEQIGKQKKAQKLLSEYLPDFDGEEWELALLQFHLGKLSERELLNQAGNHRGKLSEAFFYAGYQYLLRGESNKAQRYFQKVVDTKAYCHYEYLVAGARLNERVLK